MAKVYGDAGSWRLVFVDHTGKRRTLRMARLPRRDLESVGRRIELLVVSKISGEALDPETARWLAGVGDELRDKLVRLQLCGPKAQRQRRALAEFTTAYIDQQQVKIGTRVMLGQTQTALVTYFGPDKPLDEITTGQAEEWNWWQRKPKQQGGYGKAEATARRNCGRARQFFDHALALGLIDRNPFRSSKLPTQVPASPAAKEFFVTREQFAALLEVCPDQEWRAIVTLSRIAGLRIPSELAGLKWSSVNWERGTLLVKSPKTERHVGRESREVPLFPELRRELWDLLTIREAGPEEPIINPKRNRNANLRTQFHRLCRRAGVPAYPKPFANARASRATELAAEYPQHVVTAWMGHTPAVAQKHYLRVREEDLAKAIGPARQLAQPTLPTGTLLAQIRDGATQFEPCGAVSGTAEQVEKRPRAGSNIPPFSAGILQIHPAPGAPAGTNDPGGAPREVVDTLAAAMRADPRVLHLLEVWPTMSPEARSQVLDSCGVWNP